MTVTHRSPLYLKPSSRVRYYKDYNPFTRRRFQKRHPELPIHLTNTSDLHLWNVFHPRLSADNLPPEDVILADTDVAAWVQLAVAGAIRYCELQKKWPTTFDRLGRPLLRRKPQGLPAIAYFKGDEKSPEGYYYLSCMETYTLCGQEYAECHLESYKLESNRGQPPYPWQHLVEEHTARGSYPLALGRQEDYITIDRHVPVDWACIVHPKVICWDHMSPDMIMVITSNACLFPPDIVRLCLESDDKNGRDKMMLSRHR